ncbi:hypothetical protein ACFV9G_00595 [Nocardioides sp. NPDC059952]|uniref:hypothetical protein n=1 Tax=Nocardioides sp. NPDC059952 TaxID=3347014 RepID=UPI00365F2325
MANNTPPPACAATALYVNNALIDATGDVLMPAYYMIAGSVVGLIALFFVVETAGKSIRGTEIPGTPESEAELAELDSLDKSV